MSLKYISTINIKNTGIILCTLFTVSVLTFPVRACFKDCKTDVYFTGVYSDETCNVVINNSSSHEVVTLPRIPLASLDRNGNEAGSVPFNITLKDCPASRTITLFFNSSISSADKATGNLLNDDGNGLSKGVQIRLRKENNSQVVIDDAVSGQDYIISSAAESLMHRFVASYYAKGNSAVSAGQVHAVAGVELVYK